MQQFKVTHLVAVPSLLAAIGHAASSRATSMRPPAGGSSERGKVLSRLRTVVSSGDVLLPHTVQLLAKHLSVDAVMLNIYGCTETTADAMYHVVHVCDLTEESSGWSSAAQYEALRSTLPRSGSPTGGCHAGPQGSVPLGMPMGATVVHLLPRHASSCSDKTPTYQLLVTGPCVADGYLAATETTEPVTVLSLEQLENQEAGVFIHVSSAVLQHLADR